MSDLITLATFERVRGPYAKQWQLEDFREHCIDEGIARQRKCLFTWLRLFREHTRIDAELFDSNGDGCFSLAAP